MIGTFLVFLLFLVSICCVADKNEITTDAFPFLRRAFRPDFVLIRQNMRDAGEDYKSIVLGLKFGGVPSINSLEAVYHFQVSVSVSSKVVAGVYNECGISMFPVVSHCRKKYSRQLPKKLLHIKEKNSAGGRQSFASDVQHFIHRDYKTATSGSLEIKRRLKQTGPRSIYKQAPWSIVCLFDRHQGDPFFPLSLSTWINNKHPGSARIVSFKQQQQLEICLLALCILYV